jgi:5-methylcytosine-specific restriction protein A
MDEHLRAVTDQQEWGIDAGGLATSLIGRTIPTPADREPNTIIDVSAGNVLVGTEASPDGARVPLRAIQDGLNILLRTGELRIEPATFGGLRRSSAIGAILATLDGVDVSAGPTWLRLGRAPLRDALEQICALRPRARLTRTVSRDEPLAAAMAIALPEQVRRFLPGGERYKVQGSAGEPNTNWAETPVLAVFDRLVTDTPRRGHYVAFLFRSNGDGVVLCLTQSTTEIREQAGPGYLGALRARADQLASLLSSDHGPFSDGPVDLSATGARSRGYEQGTVLTATYPAGAIPHDAVIASHLRRLLTLGDELTMRLDAGAAAADEPAGAQPALESRRLRWHYRAEGRNNTLVKRAKRLQGLSCQACRRDYAAEFGKAGTRVMDAHHRVPFSELDAAPTALDPVADFDIVCANCHRMLHSRTPPLTVEELKQLLDRTETSSA